MAIETLNTKPRLIRYRRTFNLSNVTFDLPTLIKNMKLSHGWLKGELISKILLKRSEKQILLTAIHERTVIKSFQSKDSITFQTIEGKLVFQTHMESFSLAKGQQFTLRENIEYTLTAIEETVFLLTISDTGKTISENKMDPGLKKKI